MSVHEDQNFNSLVIKEELQIVRKIVQDEIWYEGERRHAFVPPEDVVVAKNVQMCVDRDADAITKEALEIVLKKCAILNIKRKCLEYLNRFKSKYGIENAKCYLESNIS